MFSTLVVVIFTMITILVTITICIASILAPAILTLMGLWRCPLHLLQGMLPYIIPERLTGFKVLSLSLDCLVP